MKRIFIAIHYMEIGGAERSLLGLLNAIDKSRCAVDLFVYSHTGEFMPLIPKGINLLPEVKEYTALERPIKDIIREGHILIAIARIRARLAFRRYMKRSGNTEGSAIFQFVADYTTPLLPSLRSLGEYDLAISFLTPHNIVLEKVAARRKLAWIHTDYSTIQVDAERELRVWSRYDNIVSISPAVSETFLTAFPSLAGRLTVIENILSPAFVREQAALSDVSAEMKAPPGAVRLCTVGRFSPPKKLEDVPWIARRLAELGANVCWFIVGYGGGEALVREQIAKAGVGDRVILLGKKANPYPYMLAADIYVQPSRYEGKAVTVREAQMLMKPVVITNFPTAKSQLQDGVDGVIVPLDIEGCAQGLAKVIADKELQQRLAAHLAAHDYGNEAEVEKIYELM